MLEKMLQEILPKGWKAGDWGESLICPHGHHIELDGECYEGCVSPPWLRGLI